MFGVLGKIFVDHLERTFEDVLHDRRYLVFHQALKVISIFGKSTTLTKLDRGEFEIHEV